MLLRNTLRIVRKAEIIIYQNSQINTSYVRLFASNKNDGSCKPPPRRSDECTTGAPRRSIKNCKPETPLPPTPTRECKNPLQAPVPPRVDTRTSDCKIPPYPECEAGSRTSTHSAQDCGKSHMMKECPQPECPYDDSSRQKKYTKHLFGGVLFLLASLAAIYYIGMNKRRDSPPPSVVKVPSKKQKKVRRIPRIPLSSADIPNEIPYLLIGGGTASFSAFRAIKSIDPTAKVLVITNDGFYPYMRPPLSKEMWFNEDPVSTKQLQFKQWNGTERSIFYEPEDFYAQCKGLKEQANGGVAVARGWSIKKLDVYERKAYLDDGYEIHYDKCLLATGSIPRNLDLFENAPKNIREKEIYDFEEIDEVIKDGAKSIVVIGGSFLGSELACALARRGRKNQMRVHQIYRESGNMAKILPEYLSQWTTERVKDEGVNVINNTEVEDVNIERNTLILTLNNGEKVKAQQVIVAIGVDPNTELAEESGLEIDEDFGGYLVNAELMARSHLWIAGDCTCFYDTQLGRRRVEHHDHAVVSGRLAGENMTGAGKPYWHQSMFWSDLGPDVGYEAIGIVDAALPTVGVFAKATDKDTPKAVVTATDEGNRAKMEARAPPVQPAKKPPTAPKDGEDYGKGVIFYLRDDIVVGIVLWNVFNRMSVARQVLKDGKKYKDLNEVAKLFNIHEE
uniref:Apoptosis-inducing factor 1, mitochondrial n=1 Tax=Timema cristinae TaxID=61476 RepID=A0A7R9H3E7_TIMCR|nr:unnamed protein product [Timema cristinae]